MHSINLELCEKLNVPVETHKELNEDYRDDEEEDEKTKEESNSSGDFS